MLLRMLVNSFLRQTAARHVHQAATRSRESESPPNRSADESAAAKALPQEIPPCDVALVFALGIESGGLVDLLPGAVTSHCQTFVEHVASIEGRRIVVIESGVGRQAATRATDDLLAIHRPRWIVSAGFAGGLRQPLRRGHILMADTVVDVSGNRLSVGMKLADEVTRTTKGLHVGRLLTVDKIVATQREKQTLAERHGALACDMETMAVAEACRSAAVRFLSVRVISDAVDDRLPPEVESLLNQTSLAGKLGAATGAIFKRPSSVKDMWKLKEDAIKASDRLAKFLLGVLPQLTGETDAADS